MKGRGSVNWEGEGGEPPAWPRPAQSVTLGSSVCAAVFLYGNSSWWCFVSDSTYTMRGVSVTIQASSTWHCLIPRGFWGPLRTQQLQLVQNGCYVPLWSGNKEEESALFHLPAVCSDSLYFGLPLFNHQNKLRCLLLSQGPWYFLITCSACSSPGAWWGLAFLFVHL